MIKEHSITTIIDIQYLFEYIRDLGLDYNEYEEYRLMLLEDINNKNELPDFQESIRKVLNALILNISDISKQNKVKNFIENKAI